MAPRVGSGLNGRGPGVPPPRESVVTGPPDLAATLLPRAGANQSIFIGETYLVKPLLLWITYEI